MHTLCAFRCIIKRFFFLHHFLATSTTNLVQIFAGLLFCAHVEIHPKYYPKVSSVFKLNTCFYTRKGRVSRNPSTLTEVALQETWKKRFDLHFMLFCYNVLQCILGACGSSQKRKVQLIAIKTLSCRNRLFCPFSIRGSS